VDFTVKGNKICHNGLGCATIAIRPFIDRFPIGFSEMMVTADSQMSPKRLESVQLSERGLVSLAFIELLQLTII
jgi:hypothetical protein